MKLIDSLLNKVQMNKTNKSKNNEGNSMVLVLVSVALVMLVLSMIFVMMIMQYKMLQLGRQSKDNFYYIEEVLEEIRAGVGNESVYQLKLAYDDTASMVVYYDTNQQKYMSVSSETAENIMDNKFFNNIEKVYGSISSDQLQTKLLSYVKNFDPDENIVRIYSEKNGSTVEITPAKITFGPDFKCEKILSKNPVATLGYAITDLTVSRVDEKGNDQSITTDLTIYPPEEAMNFLGTGTDLENIFTYSMVADYGIVVGATKTDSGVLAPQKSTVTVSGNMYAAKDTRNNGIYGASVSGGTDDDADITLSGSSAGGDGSTPDSLYSGLFVTGVGTYLGLQSDIVSISGSIAANDCAEINSNKKNSSRTNTAMSTLWAENIATLGTASKNGDKYTGATIHLNAQACLSDDLELNSDYSDVKLDGIFIGYNYDSEEEVDGQVPSKETSLDDRAKLTAEVTGNSSEYEDPYTHVNKKRHTKSSAIIVNGKRSKLNMSELSELIVSGKSYIDMVGANSVKNDKVTDYDIRTGESIMTKGTQLVYRVLESNDISPTIPVLSTVDKKADGTVTGGTKTAGNQELKTNVPTYYMGKFLMYQFFQDKGYLIFHKGVDGYEPKYDSWSSVSEGTYEIAWKSIAESGTGSGYYKMLQDIMACYFPTDKSIVSSISDSGEITYEYKDISTVDVVDCYGNSYKIPKNDDTICTTTSKDTTTGKYEEASAVHQYGFMTVGAAYDHINLIKTVVSTGTGDSVDYSDYYYYQFYDEAAKEEFVVDFAAYTADKKTQKALGYSIKDVTSKDLFETDLVTLPDEKSGARYYSRGVTTIIEDNAKAAYELIPSKKSSLTKNITDVMDLYDKKVAMARVFKCYFPKSETYVTDSQKDIADSFYRKGDTTVNGTTSYDMTIAGDNISPLSNPDCININWKLVQDKDLKGVELDGYPGTYVWACEGKDGLVIDGSNFDNATIKGIVVCQGDVTLKNVKKFTGTIICAGKLYIVGDNVEFYVDDQMCNAMIQNDTSNQIRTCFGLSELKDEEEDSTIGVSVSSIKYSDIVGYANWKKNAE